MCLIPFNFIKFAKSWETNYGSLSAHTYHFFVQRTVCVCTFNILYKEMVWYVLSILCMKKRKWYTCMYHFFVPRNSTCKEIVGTKNWYKETLHTVSLYEETVRTLYTKKQYIRTVSLYIRFLHTKSTYRFFVQKHFFGMYVPFLRTETYRFFVQRITY